ncbi:MAG: peptidoglycan-binding domain-containing protein [Gemmatimonadota bacterium]
MPPNSPYTKQVLERARDRASLALVFLLAAALSAPSVVPASQSRSADAGVVRFTEFFEPATESRIRRAADVLTPPEIERVQEALSTRGHLVLAPSGIFDSRTESALTRFQNATGLPVCGCLSYSTVLALGLRPVITQVVITESGTEPGAADIGPAHGVELLYSAGTDPVPQLLVEMKGSERDEALQADSTDASLDEPEEPTIRLFIPFFGLPGFLRAVCD